MFVGSGRAATLPIMCFRIRQLGWVLLVLCGVPAHGACEDKAVTLTDHRVGDVISLVANVQDGMDITLTVEASLQNMTSSRSLPCTFDLSGQHTVEIMKLWPGNPNAAWRYSYRYFWRYGGRHGRLDPAVVYELPYSPQEWHRLAQGNFGRFSHGPGSQNEHAFDFSMPVGTDVRAARAGTVTGVRADSTSGGADPVFKECANYVIIRHSDGTYAEYLHLSTAGVLVRVGERVKTGQVIARSGNTGYSSGPHLHFCVFRALDGKTRETLPVRFRLKDGAVDPLTEGQTY